jgi:uncharacterized protein YjbI with pentapeptide repeats
LNPKTYRKRRAKPAAKPWRQFERYVAELYQELGAKEIAHDINICGNQIDVFAVVPSYDGSQVKTILSCKHHKGVVGVQGVREWNQVFQALFNAREADSAVIVSKDGFTQNAQRFAKDAGVRLTTIDQLRWASCDFAPYLQSKVSEFHAEPLFQKKHYIPLKVRFDGTQISTDADEAVLRFLAAADEAVLILLGDFGAGKTTFTKHLFQVLTGKFFEAPDANRMPIHVNLREYPGHLNLSSLMTDLLVNQYRSRCPGFSSVERLQREGKLVVIFDAFDEMASRTDYQTTLQNFQALERLIIGKGKIVLTCRTHYFKDQEEVATVYGGTELYKISRQKRYQLAYVEGFQSEQIEAYVRAVCGDEWPKYLRQIRETYNLQGLAQRPILLDMITEVLPNLVKKGQAVDSATLYSVYVDFWLKRDDWRTTLSRDERLRFTTAFAVAIYNTKADVFKWEDVEKAVRTRWPESTKKELEHYQYDIRTCSFIRWEPKTGDYKFVHQSFMEHFVASRLYEGIIHGDKQGLMSRNHTDGVLHFLSELKGTEQARETLLRWLRARSSDTLVRNAFSVLKKWQPQLNNEGFGGIRLSELTLAGMAFVECKFANCILNLLKLPENRWERCKIRDSNISGCIWADGHLKELDLQRCRISTTAIRKTRLENVNFTDCELLEIELSGEGVGSHFDGCSLRNCDFRGWTGSASQFFNCVFIDVYWNSEALEGAEFSGGKFLAGAELLLVRATDKLHRTTWKKAPVFRGVSGLSKDLRDQLIRAGAKFLPKLRLSTKPREMTLPASERELKLWEELTEAESDSDELLPS